MRFWLASRHGALVLALGLPATAAADDWSGSFASNVRDDHFRDAKSIAVVRPDDAADAAIGLTDRLRALGAKLVELPAASRKIASGEADVPALKRIAAAKPKVSRVAVVRVFPGSGKRPKTALVVVYDLAGTALRAFVAEGPGAAPGLAAAEEQFARESLTFGRWVGVAEDGRVVLMDSRYDVVILGQGASKRAISWPEFYRRVGRPELAASWKNRTVASYSALGAGVLGLVASVFLYADGNEAADLTAGASLALIAGGTIGTYYANPCRRTEVQKMVDDHNAGLKARLGIAYRAPPDRPAGMGMALALRF